MSPIEWKDLQETRERLAEIEQVVLAMVREKRIERGETETLSRAEMTRRLDDSPHDLKERTLSLLEELGD